MGPLLLSRLEESQERGHVGSLLLYDVFNKGAGRGSTDLEICLALLQARGEYSFSSDTFGIIFCQSVSKM